MATPTDDALARTENLLRDAEEALQQERLVLFWREWGTTIIGMAVMLVVGTGAGVAWREWSQHRNERETAALVSVIDDKASVIGPETEKNLGGNHAAIAYLSKAGAIAEKDDTADMRADLAKLYDAAARTGDDTAWGWLAQLNALRLRMDDPKSDAAQLLKDYEKLAAGRAKSELSSLALTDAALVAGERLNDPARALAYLTQAEGLIAPSTPMAAVIANMKHLYQLRARTAQPATDKAKDTAQ